MNLIILEHEPLSAYTKKIWYLDKFQDNGISVEYWDISSICHKNVDYNNTIKDSRVKKINTLFGLYKAFKKKDSKTFVVDEFPFYWSNIMIYFLLSWFSVRLVRIQQYGTNLALTQRKDNKNIISRIKLYVSLIPSFSLILFTRLFRLREYKVVFSPFPNKGKCVRINHPDYEIYQENLKYLKNDGPIVFIDQYFPTHPDIKIKYNYNCTRNDIRLYYYEMNRFFDYIENKYQKKVVICPHPKARYNGDEFGGREIVSLPTARCVMQSSMIITHGSTAVSYAVMAGKPILLVYCDLFDVISKGGEIVGFIKLRAEKLGIVAYNISRINVSEVTPQCVPDSIKYNYVYTTYTSEFTDTKRNNDIILETLHNYEDI